ncbi:MAG: cytochrome c [Bacteroidetes bacterium]|nr:MAG: cytochrome c [Bacteroidota bacterium]
MRYNYLWIVLGILAIIGLLPALVSLEQTQQIADDTPVAEVLRQLGQVPPDHLPNTDIEGVSAEVGRQLVLQGIAHKPEGGSTKRQSKHFVCTSCHNVVKEDPKLTVADPAARLQYAETHDLPFLPGTTLYGVVNRSSYYNGDYSKKYGDLVRPARKNLRAAIALCATECAQGRELEDWEMESILAYLWQIDLKMSDLNLPEEEIRQLERAIQSGSQGDQTDARELLQSAYLSYSPATFVPPPPNREIGYEGVEGDPANGRIIYERSCLHCHGQQRYSFFNLDHSAYSFDFLRKHFPRYTRYSTYQVVRYGTSPLNGKKAYMPHYTLERMSNQQLEDLRAYVEQQAQ